MAFESRKPPVFICGGRVGIGLDSGRRNLFKIARYRVGLLECRGAIALRPPAERSLEIRYDDLVRELTDLND